MCLSNAIKTVFKGNSNFLDIIKKLDPVFKKNFEAKNAKLSNKTNANAAVKPTPATKESIPKQKRRLRPNTLMRSSPGRRSFLEGK